MPDLDPPDFRFLPDDVLSDGESLSDDVVTAGDPAPPLSRRAKLLGLVAITALALSGLIVQLHRAGHPEIPLAGPALPSSTVATIPRPWPTGHDICGNQVHQPVIRADVTGPPTGLSVSVGSNALLAADLDAGTVRPLLRLPRQTYLDDEVVVAGRTYAEVVDCRAGNRIIRIDRNGHQQDVLADPITRGLLADHVGGLWAARISDGGPTISEAKLQVVLQRLDHLGEIALQSLMFPLALRGRLLYAEQQPAVGRQSRLVVYDLSRQRIVKELGRFDSAAAIDGELLWLPKPCPGVTPCELDRLDLRTGQQSNGSLPLPEGFRVDGASLSPDHTRLAVQLPDPSADPRYRWPGSPPPSYVSVVDLRTGLSLIVPQVSVPAGARLGLAFAPDSRRLILAAPAASGTDFFIWAPDMLRPMLTQLHLNTALPTPAYLRATATALRS